MRKYNRDISSTPGLHGCKLLYSCNKVVLASRVLTFGVVSSGLLVYVDPLTESSQITRMILIVLLRSGASWRMRPS